MLTWLPGPSKGLLLIAPRGLPTAVFQKQNKNGVAVNILVAQGGVTTVIALLYALIPSVSSAYWILCVMTTQVYLDRLPADVRRRREAAQATSPTSRAATRLRY